MPRPSVDPAQLKGEALNRWYRRTPDEIEAERRAAEDERHEGFFGGLRTAGSRQNNGNPVVRATASDRDILWVATGSGYRAARPGQSDFLATLEPGDPGNYPPPGSAAALEEGEFLEIGNPHNRRLRREYVRQHGSWPRTPEGRNYDVAHILAVADGGTNTLDNIRPMHPDDHREEHMKNNDFRRWGARAYGNRQGPPGSGVVAEAVPSNPPPSRLSPEPPVQTGRPKSSAKPRVTAAPSPDPKTNRAAPPTMGSAPRAKAPATGPVAAAGGPRPAPALRPKRPPIKGGLGGGSLNAFALVPALSGLLSGRIRIDTPEHFWFDMAGHPAPDDPLPDLYL